MPTGEWQETNALDSYMPTTGNLQLRLYSTAAHLGEGEGTPLSNRRHNIGSVVQKRRRPLHDVEKV